MDAWLLIKFSSTVMHSKRKSYQCYHILCCHEHSMTVLGKYLSDIFYLICEINFYSSCISKINVRHSFKIYTQLDIVISWYLLCLSCTVQYVARSCCLLRFIHDLYVSYIVWINAWNFIKFWILLCIQGDFL